MGAQVGRWRPKGVRGAMGPRPEGSYLALETVSTKTIKWLTPDLPDYNGMCDHIAENVLCAFEVSQMFKRTMGPP
jgi:hypothetical protein